MSYRTIRFEKKDYVGTIDVIGPVNDLEKYVLLADELSDLCSTITSDDEIRVVILTGVGKGTFSLGMGLSGGVLGVDRESSIGSRSLSELLAKLDQPVIAAINGDAVGQGLEIALACDIRIAAETSRFGLPHIKTGLIPQDGGTQRLPRLVGRGKALEMILTGEMIEAQEAYRIGLVNKIVPPRELITVAMDMAKEMASKGPIALRYAKEAIYKGMDVTLEQGLRLEADLYFLLHTTRDRTEGINAFLEKRTPKFEGR
jgi:enoyl-CoA hydratase/carnithine racemase